MPDPSRWARPGVIVSALLWLSACATPSYAPWVPERPPEARQRPVAPPQPSAVYGATAPLTVLPGWNADDHAAALRAFQATCLGVVQTTLKTACWRAERLGSADENAARDFFEDNFRAARIADTGLLTAYFLPEYPARERPEGTFTAPVRPRPPGLPSSPATPYLTRAAIEADPADQALAWMRPEDLFFMQIQGSGVLDFPDGRRMKAVFAASNGQPFTPIAGVLRQRGALGPRDTSGDSIRAWLADHRGPDADQVMQANARYIFFALTPDNGAEPPGTAGTPLVPGRSIAVDPVYNPLGGLYWLDASTPLLNGAFPTYRRLVVALDTGGAIKGPARVDLYMGRGAAAGAEAGRARHELSLYRLVPLAPGNP
jgi:membrane-bound lytic murein transglycosylase A